VARGKETWKESNQKKAGLQVKGSCSRTRTRSRNGRPFPKSSKHTTQHNTKTPKVLTESIRSPKLNQNLLHVSQNSAL